MASAAASPSRPLTAAQRMRERTQQLKRNLPGEKAGAGAGGGGGGGGSGGGGAAVPTVSGRAKAQSLLAEVDTLENDLTRREESYSRREFNAASRIRELGEMLDRAAGNEPDREDEEVEQSSNERAAHLKGYHQEIMENLDVVQDATTQILQDQERDLLRAFKARLFDVQTELDREKSKKDDSAAAWIQRSKQLQAEVDWAKEMADRLERVNKGLEGENQDMKGRIRAGEEDRNYLVTQLVAVKKDNVRLTQELERTDGEIKELAEIKENPKARGRMASMNSSTGGGSGGGGGGIGGMGAKLPSVEKYEASKAKRMEEIKRLKRLLESQQRGLRAVRASYAGELHTRTELQRFLKQCLLDIRSQI
jgi:hypothetical protein